MQIKFKTVFSVFFSMGIVLSALGQRGVQESSESKVSSTPSSKLHAGFNIFYGDSKVGTYDAYKTREGSKDVYKASSISKVKFFGEIVVKFDMTCIYTGNSLEESTVLSTRNGKIISDTQISKSGSGYKIKSKGDESFINVPIEMSVVKLYFHEPSDGMDILAENQGIMKETKKVEKGSYLVVEPGENSGSEYIYQNNLLQKINVSTTFANFSVVRR